MSGLKSEGRVTRSRFDKSLNHKLNFNQDLESKLDDINNSPLQYEYSNAFI